ncbi:hypothetical protein QTP70_010209 [Hemibagrus guttatus]|uniref:ribonuclease H n=1 Tax=Hemibagrus guttatus TaxID=175788 RepID=A0AAE0PU24_9TELE|nr:hypothetical protein QTP70_010209 [Hemibagrus guttatus]
MRKFRIVSRGRVKAKKKWDMDRTEENRQEYKELPSRVKREVSKAKQKAYDELYTRLDTREGEKDLYRLARQRDRDGKDVQQKVDKIRKDEVRKALKRMKSGKAVGPDDIPVEVWKCLGEAAVEFLTDLEKAYDRVSREELWYCMRKSGVAEKYVRVVQDMYERSRTVVSCAVSQTEEFKVEVGLHQGSALSPFLFAMVMDWLSEEVIQKCTMMFADDIVICSESREQVEENLERWRFALDRRGMKVSRSKTEYMCVNEREGSGTVRLQSEEVKKVQEFKYLGSTVQSNGECGKEKTGPNSMDPSRSQPDPLRDLVAALRQHPTLVRQRIPLAMLPGPGDATTPVPYRAIQGGVYYHAAEQQGTSLGRVPLVPESAAQSYSGFIEHFKEVFGKPSWDSSIGEELCKLKQGKMTVSEYALQFRTLAAKSGWNEQALLAAYRQCLDPQVRLHLTAYKDAIGLKRLIQLSIRVATRMQSCIGKH